MGRWRSFGRFLVGATIVGLLVAVALWPSPVVVDVATVARGALVVTIDEEGQTRVRDRYMVSAPVSGRVLRIDLEAGDAVSRGQVVARVQAESASLLDTRTLAELRASLDAAKATLGRMRAEEERLKAAAEQAARDLDRAKALAAQGLVTEQEVDARDAAARASKAAVEAGVYATQVAAADVEQTSARLRSPSVDRAAQIVSVRAPVDGVVLKRLRESESAVPAGEPLVEIGDPHRLEIVSDLLSTDAVQVRAGARALIEQWGGARVLEATVRRVEPAGFTKISALGVEEQRVNVILDFVDPVEAWAALGDAYRVEVRVVLWEGKSVLVVPTGALFRAGERWAVYVVSTDGRAREQVVEIGQQNGQHAEVRSGLAEGAQVILHPADTLTDGTRVVRREP